MVGGGCIPGWWEGYTQVGGGCVYPGGVYTQVVYVPGYTLGLSLFNRGLGLGTPFVYPIVVSSHQEDRSNSAQKGLKGLTLLGRKAAQRASSSLLISRLSPGPRSDTAVGATLTPSAEGGWEAVYPGWYGRVAYTQGGIYPGMVGWAIPLF